MISYNTALKHYNSITKPPRAAYWQTVPDNGKPLRGTSEKHKSIHMRGDGAIYYQLYSTPVATFYPVDPTTNTYTVAMRNYNSPTTQKFMRDQGLHYHVLRTANGTRQIPYAHTANGKPTAILTFDADTDLLITDLDKSWHPTVQTKVVSGEQKGVRAHLRKRLETYVTLAMFNIDNLMAQAAPHENYVRPFYNPATNPFDGHMVPLYNFNKALKEGVRYIDSPERVDIVVDDPQFPDQFMGTLPALMSLHLSYKAVLYESEQWDKTHKVISFRDALDVVKPTVDPTKFAKYVMSYMERSFMLNEGRAYKEHPLFMLSLPRKYCIDWKSQPPASLSKYNYPV